MQVDGIAVSLEQLAKGGPIVVSGSLPQFAVRYVLARGVHALSMSGTGQLVPWSGYTARHLRPSVVRQSPLPRASTQP